jgi:hypothetical protein
MSSSRAAGKILPPTGAPHYFVATTTSRGLFNTVPRSIWHTSIDGLIKRNTSAKMDAIK